MLKGVSEFPLYAFCCRDPSISSMNPQRDSCKQLIFGSEFRKGTNAAHIHIESIEALTAKSSCKLSLSIDEELKQVFHQLSCRHQLGRIHFGDDQTVGCFHSNRCRKFRLYKWFSDSNFSDFTKSPPITCSKFRERLGAVSTAY